MAKLVKLRVLRKTLRVCGNVSLSMQLFNRCLRIKTKTDQYSVWAALDFQSDFLQTSNPDLEMKSCTVLFLLRSFETCCRLLDIFPSRIKRPHK